MSRSDQAAGEALDHDSLAQAAEWYARLLDAPADAALLGGWQAWMAQRPAHRLAWDHIEAVRKRFELLQLAGPRDAVLAGLRGGARPAGNGRRRALGALLCVGAGALLARQAWRFPEISAPLLALASDYATGIGEVRRIVLPDDSLAVLDTASAFDFDRSADARRLWLRQGGVYVETAPDPRRPFSVHTPHGSVLALGTHFSVDRARGHSRVRVLEGAVRVRLADSGRVETVQAGMQLRFDAETAFPATPTGPADVAWTGGHVLADGMPLGQLVERLARYQYGHLAADPRVAELQVTGRFPLTEPDRALDLLEAVLPVRVQRALPWWRTVVPREV